MIDYAETTQQFLSPRSQLLTITYRLETNDFNTVSSCLTHDEYGLRGLQIDGLALAIENTEAYAGVNPVYTVVPITVECFVRIPPKSNSAEIILLANEGRGSGTHWDLFVEKSTGHFGVVLPNFKTARIISKQNIADGQWHFVAMQFEPTRIRLFVDGQPVADQVVARRGSPDPAAGATEGLPKA